MDRVCYLDGILLPPAYILSVRREEPKQVEERRLFEMSDEAVREAMQVLRQRVGKISTIR